MFQNNQELIGKAERCEWSLECDEKLLNLMQNVATVSQSEKLFSISLNLTFSTISLTIKKIESRSTNTRSNLNTMMLSADETKVKLSNLTRINSIKNTNYCENLIRDDHLELDTDDDAVKKKEPVSCIIMRCSFVPKGINRFFAF